MGSTRRRYPPRSTTKATDLGPESPIPDKLYFKIGEVANLVGVQTHVLRYWEKEIPIIRPSKSPSNQRRYRYKDVEHFREVRRLLHEERYTLAGARRQLLSSKNSGDTTKSGVSSASKHASEAALGQPAPQATCEAADVSEGPTLDPSLERVRAGLRELIRLSGEDPWSAKVSGPEES